ncbi:MAG: DUF4238 domain-containing protein [Terriglobales bacterium]|jgi:hypothetical protein
MCAHTRELVVRQHFVCACYLARFTMEGRRDSLFYVFSPDGSPMREATPNSVGFERHYHDIDVPGFRPDHLEGFFQEFEGPACGLFKALSTNPGRSLATQEERGTIASFVALQAARIPPAKNKYENLVIDSRKAFIQEMASSSDFFDEVLAAAKKHGVEIDSTDRGRLLEALQGGHIVPQVHKTELSVGILRLAHAIADQLDGMNYSLLYSDGPEWFVCSDYPVGLSLLLAVTDDLLEHQKAIEWPTVQPFGRTIFMPIAYNVAIAIHRFENRPTAVRADQRMVARINTITIANAERFICSPVPDFACVLPNKELGRATNAVAVLQQFTRRERADSAKG